MRRIEGQARGLQRMVEKEQYCIDIPRPGRSDDEGPPVLALGLLYDHIAHCVVDAATGGARGRGQAQEACDAIARLVRS